MAIKNVALVEVLKSMKPDLIDNDVISKGLEPSTDLVSLLKQQMKDLVLPDLFLHGGEAMDAFELKGKLPARGIGVVELVST